MTRRLSSVRLFMMWTAQHVRQTLRNPQATFFTIVFPLLLLVLFSAPRHSSKVAIDGGQIAFAQFFTPSIATFATMTSCLTGLVIGLTWNATRAYSSGFGARRSGPRSTSPRGSRTG